MHQVGPSSMLRTCWDSWLIFLKNKCSIDWRRSSMYATESLQARFERPSVIAVLPPKYLLSISIHIFNFKHMCAHDSMVELPVLANTILWIGTSGRVRPKMHQKKLSGTNAYATTSKGDAVGPSSVCLWAEVSILSQASTRGYPSAMYSSSNTSNHLQQNDGPFSPWSAALLATAALVALGKAPTPYLLHNAF